MPKRTKKRQYKEPPPELAELIRFENLLPNDFVFETPSLTQFERPSFLHGEFDIEGYEKMKAKLPEELQSLITSSTYILLDEVGKYYSLAETLTTLKHLAEYLTLELWEIERYRKLPSDEKEKEKYKRLQDIEFKRQSTNHKMFLFSSQIFEINQLTNLELMPFPYFCISPTFSTNYQLCFRSTYLMEIVKDIDARRLRICERCNHVFWAYRLDKRCCSTECGNALKMRNYRRKKKESRERLDNHFQSRAVKD